MTNWDRKEADALASALVKHIAASGKDAPESTTLSVILRETSFASKNVDTTHSKLIALRMRVCEICRANRLYECDVPSGWSSNCAFIVDNETKFGDL